MQNEIKIHKFLNTLLNDFDERRKKVLKELKEEINLLKNIAESLRIFEQKHLKELENIFPQFKNHSEYENIGFLGYPINEAYSKMEQYNIKYIREHFYGFSDDVKDKEKKDLDMYHVISLIKETGPISIEYISEKTFIPKKLSSICLNSLLKNNIWEKHKCERRSGFYYCPGENYKSL